MEIDHESAFLKDKKDFKVIALNHMILLELINRPFQPNKSANSEVIKPKCEGKSDMAVNCGFLLLVLALCSGFAVLRAQGKLSERCDQGWNFYGGNCYFREDSKAAMTTWEMAQKICETKQANLVTVNDASEQKFLEGILGERGSWCGLNNKDNQKELKWVSGEKSDYTNWAPNQPSKSNRRRCVHIQVASDNHKWVMQRCTRQFRFTCEKAASPLKPCAASPCQNGGTCIEQGAGYKCQCPVKFTGNNCETPIVINPCDSNPCLNGGTCTATGNGYSCQCPDKFTGKNCEQSLDACSPNPCMNGGQCYDTGNNKYLCVCVGAFKGDNCEKVDCDKWPCKNGGTCLELGDKAFCKCPSGFTGATCEGVVPSITQDPQDKTGLEGDEVTLCCKAEGTPAPKYQCFLLAPVKAADKTPVIAAHAARGTLTGKPTTVTAVPRLEAERTLDKPPIEIAE
ncbi:hypothetical protein ACROYT_G020931 [Oculina patagonica]